MLLIFFLAFVWIMPSVRSHVIMSAASWYESFRVLGRDEGLKIEFAAHMSDKDRELNWYSKMLLFNNFDVAFSRLGLEGEGSADLSIYYTFGDFNEGRSIIYNDRSPYNSSFHGAYIVKLNPDLQLMESVDLGKIAQAVTRYDYSSLILSQLGLNHEDAYFEPNIISVNSDISMFDCDGWVQIDSDIITRSVSHRTSGFKQHYVQFGSPNAIQDSEDFPEKTLYGRTYIRYFQEESLYVIFYILAGDQTLLEKTDETLLSHSRVVILDKP